MLDGEFWQVRVQCDQRMACRWMVQEMGVLWWFTLLATQSVINLERLCHKVVERSHMITRHARRAVFDHSRLPPDA
jgi:hypothetical protein